MTSYSMSPSTTIRLKPANWDEITARTYSITPLEYIIPRVFVNLAILFPFAESNNPSAISGVIDSLKNGVVRTLAQFPQLNTRVQVDPLTGTLKMVVPTAESDIGVRFVERILTDPDEFPDSYDDLRSAHFPTSKFDVKFFSPFQVLWARGDSEVFAIQVTVIRGGVVLVPCLHHVLADGPAFDTLIKYLSENISGIETTVSENILDKTALLPPYNIQPRPHPEFAILPHKEVIGKVVQPHPSDYETRIYSFPAPKLAALKAAAAASNPTGWISTNDCLAALLWRSRVKTGLHTRVLKDTDVTAFTLAVNARPNVPLPEEWFGNIVMVAIATQPVPALHAEGESHLDPTSLGPIALAIRNSINASRVAGQAVSILSFIDSVPDKRDISPVSPGGRRITLSSWESMKTYSYRFGVLGSPECVRTCAKSNHVATMIVLPKNGATQRTEVMLSSTKEEWHIMHDCIVEAGGELLSI